MTSVLRVELFFDEEAGNWHYRVPPCTSTAAGPLPVRTLSATPCQPSRSHCRATPGTTTPTPKPSPST